MKPKFTNKFFGSITTAFAAALFTHFITPSAQAVALTWDTTIAADAIITAGSGTWTNGAGNWNNGATSVGINWNNPTPDTAKFQAGDDLGTHVITVGGPITTSAGTRSATAGQGGLVFSNSGYSLTAASALSVTVGGTTGNVSSVVNVAAGKTATIGNNVTLQGGAGTGGLFLLDGGTLEIASGGTLTGTATGASEVAGGGSTLWINGGAATFGGSLSLGKLLAANAEGASGNLIVDSGSLTISGTGNLAVGRTNGDTCVATLNDGTITAAGGSLNFGLTTSTSTGSFHLNGGTLTVKSVTSTANVTSTFNFNGGTLKAAASATSAFMTGLDTAQIRNGAAVIDSNGQAIIIGQLLAHSILGGDNAIDGGLTMNDSAVTKGSLSLTAANTFNGPTKITAGILSLGNSLAIQNSSLNTLNSVTGGAASGLKTTVSTLTFGGLTGNKNLADVFTTASGGYDTVTALTLNPGTGVTHNYSGIIANGAPVGMTLTKTGAGAQILSGANSYDGLTSIATGSLVLNGSGTLGSTAAGTSVASGSSLALSGVGDFGTGETLTITGSGVSAANHFFPGSVGSRGALQSISGSNTYAGNIELGTDTTIRIGSQDGASLTVTGTITQATGITSANILFRSGNNAGDYVTLSNASNSFGGNSQVFSGATAGNAGVRLGVDNALPAGLTISGFTGAGAGTALNLNGFDQSLNGLITGAGGLNIINSDTVNSSILTLNPTADKATTNTLIRGGVGLGAINVVKDGAFSQTLSGTHDYTGTTAVIEGALHINGNVSTSNFTVGSTATLGGTGAIGGTVTVNNGGTLSSGASIESLATGALTLNDGSIFDYGMSNDAPASDAGDLTAVTGGLTLDLTNLAVLTLTDEGAGSWAAGEKLTLISYTGTWNGSLFTYGLGTLADDSTFTFSGVQWEFNYNDNDAGDNFIGDLTGSSFVTMTAIPEPRAALLGGLGLLALLRRRR